MEISNYFNEHTPSLDQKQALNLIENFIENDSNIFLLKGYAGTGKTTLIKALINYFQNKKIAFKLMAPTGRAAKILRDKTKYGDTIHKTIYNFNTLESLNKDHKDEAEHSFHYFFPLNTIENSNRHILIVDEASMISNIESKHELFTFGTNNLLNDLFTFSALKTTRNKIIFVGDPAQLPPVNDSQSRALDFSFLSDKGYNVEEFFIKEIKRQSDNLILKNATKTRLLIETDKRIHFTLDYDNSSFVKLDPNKVVSTFCNLYPIPEIGNGIIISFSNKQCYEYNKAIREKIFPKNQEITPGDLLILNNNNYHTFGVELYNGDIVKVIETSDELITQSAPVWCEENGNKIRKEITLNFRKIKIRLEKHPEDVECMIIDSFLNSINKSLSLNEMKALYINFVMRFNEKQNIKKEKGLPFYKVGSIEFKDELKNDPFYNALKVKYGYAITCHKAQGGEWKNVFVDFYGRVSLKTDPLRWSYTAQTRGIDTVYAINPPNFGFFSELKFSPVGNIGSPPNESLKLDNILTSPFHSENQNKCKSLKYWEILEKLENTEYTIQKVESKDYLERYYITSNNNEKIIIDGHHKGSGHFLNPFKVISENCKIEVKEKLEQIFNKQVTFNTNLQYNPTKLFLENLYSKIQDICEELDISISNIVEYPYYVNYYFITDAKCAYIQFYFNNKESFTTAIPKSLVGEDDVKLIKLINKLNEYVI